MALLNYEQDAASYSLTSGCLVDLAEAVQGRVEEAADDEDVSVNITNDTIQFCNLQMQVVRTSAIYNATVDVSRVDA